MAVSAVLFDLDGTLLPLDQDEFSSTYFKSLAAYAATIGYSPEAFTETIMAGTIAMIKNTGEKTNEAVFWELFSSRYGESSLKDMPLFDKFYHTDFQRIKGICGFSPKAPETVAMLKERGIRVVLATNPLFPAIATQSRIRWAGLEPEDFELYTTYENSRHCKPNPKYYHDIMYELELDPAECIMVGNDVDEDMIAAILGMDVFLLTDCLVNRRNRDISQYPHGDFNKLADFLRSII